MKKLFCNLFCKHKRSACFGAAQKKVTKIKVLVAQLEIDFLLHINKLDD